MGTGVAQSDRSYLRLLRSRDRSNERGNTVYAITCAIRASQCATSETKRARPKQKAREMFVDWLIDSRGYRVCQTGYR